MTDSKTLICGKNSNMHFYEIKKMQWASTLNALMIHSGKSRSEIAHLCGISKGRVTRILSGHSNLTIETICLFAHALNYDVDIAFHNSPLTKPYQPWNIGQKEFATFRAIKEISSNERNITTISSNPRSSNELLNNIYKPFDFLQASKQEFTFNGTSV